MISEYARIRILSSDITTVLEIAESGANLVSDRKVDFSRNLGCALVYFYGHYSSRDLHVLCKGRHCCRKARQHVHTARQTLLSADMHIVAGREMYVCYARAGVVAGRHERACEDRRECARVYCTECPCLCHHGTNTAQPRRNHSSIDALHHRCTAPLMHQH